MAKDYVAGWHFLRFAKITADTVASKFIPADRFSNNWVGCESFHVFFSPKFLLNKIQQLSWMQKMQERICGNLNLDFHIFTRNWAAKNIKTLEITFICRIVVMLLLKCLHFSPVSHWWSSLLAFISEFNQSLLFDAGQIVGLMFLMGNGFAKVNQFSETTTRTGAALPKDV